MGSVTNARSAPRPPFPTISVTKPPAPLPLELPSPTADSPSFAEQQLPDDLEAGNSMQFETSSASSSVASVTPLRAVSPPVISPTRAVSPPSRTFTDSPDTLHAASPTLPITDLLEPTSPMIATAVFDAGSPTKPSDDSFALIHADDVESEEEEEVDEEEEEEAEDEGAEDEEGDEEEDEDEDDEDDEEEEEEEEAPIRLVGGGGISGTVDDSIEDDIVIVDDSQSVELKDVDLDGPASPTSGEATPTPMDEKRKSSAASRKSTGRKDTVPSVNGSG